jgi:peptide/nickel transport system ATP-binding protein
MNALTSTRAVAIESLAVRDLRITSREGLLVDGVSFNLTPGRPVTLLGESGSGKSLVAHAIMGTLPATLSATGSIRLGAVELLHLSGAERRRLWGRVISLMPQEPWLALDPTMEILPQVSEVHRYIRQRSTAGASDDARRDLAAFGLQGAEGLYPHQMSGGMCQRAASAISAAGACNVVIADEPTKGLDADRRADVVSALKATAEGGRALLTITHDVAVATALGGEIGVMLDGRMVDHGPASGILAAPKHDYSRALLEADPCRWARPASAPDERVVLRGEGLEKSFGARRLFRGADLEVRAGEVVALVGPSGCGKTTLGNALLGLTPVDAGRVTRMDDASPYAYQKLYQDPPAAFAPRQRLRQGLKDLMKLHGRPWAALEALMSRLKLQDALLDRLPSEISGGELQRFAIARALLMEPVLLFADEATSRLDPLSQKEVVSFLMEVVQERRLGLLFVTHDLDLAAGIATRMFKIGDGALTAVK